MVYIVNVVSGGDNYWLRSTVLTSAWDRATRYASEADAQAALDKARKFMPAKAYRAAIIKGIAPDA